MGEHQSTLEGFPAGTRHGADPPQKVAKLKNRKFSNIYFNFLQILRILANRNRIVGSKNFRKYVDVKSVMHSKILDHNSRGGQVLLTPC